MTTERRTPAAAVMALALVIVGAASAADDVSVPGCAVRFPTTGQTTIDGKPYRLTLTGAALRQKYFFNVYAVASYVREGAGLRTPEDVAALDCPKRLELVMERTVGGGEMAEAFRAAIRLNYPEPAFAAEVGELVRFLAAQEARRGDRIVLTCVPGVGLHCDLAGRAEVLIRGAQFPRAVWDVYLGKNNLGAEIKKGLTSRL